MIVMKNRVKYLLTLINFCVSRIVYRNVDITKTGINQERLTPMKGRCPLSENMNKKVPNIKIYKRVNLLILPLLVILSILL